MKRITLLLILNLSFLFFHSQRVQAQLTYIPDLNFRNWLIQNYPNSMYNDYLWAGSSEIQSELYLYPNNANINDLTGIESFINLISLDCSGNQITSLDISANSELKTLKCGNNLLTNLNVSANLNLKHLECQVNQLTNLNISSNTALLYLDCSYNQLTNLNVTSNPSLTYLDCWHNQLTNLNVSANTVLGELSCSNNSLNSLNFTANTVLTKLACSSNQLTSLSVLTNPMLTNLACGNNQLNTLDVSLNTALITLECGDNQLDSLDISANTALTLLNCSTNQLTSLNVSANTVLSTLDCSENQLSSLDISINTGITELKCFSNQLTNLDVSTNTVLTYLDCNHNPLGSLDVTANTALTELICYTNQLSSLDVSTNTSLVTLNCGSNQLSSLDISNNSSLVTLECVSNQLSSLDLSSNTFLTNLICSHNQLTNIFHIPYSMNKFRIDFNNISCLSNLPQTPAYNSTISFNQLLCVPNQTSYSGNLPLCIDNDPINNPNNCQSVVNIAGKVYSDLNSNCSLNNTDLNIDNFPIKIYDTQNNLKQISYTVNGMYSFAALPVDTYVVKVDDILYPIDMSCGQSNTKTLNLTSTTQSLLNTNFPLECDSAFDSKVHSLTPLGWVHPGQLHTLQTNLAFDYTWFNLNCNSVNYAGTIVLHVVGPVSYVTPAAGALTPVSNGNTLTYSIANFNSLTPTSLGLKLLTDTTAQSGDQICIHVSINPNAPDADTTNNEYDFCYLVGNSYDPNEKEVYPSSVLPGYNDWFTYTIHFQNTGSAPAFNIRLRDTLDSNLDCSSFEFLGASHTAKTNLIGNVLSVRFENIMLPDSTTDYYGSMGYFQYRVKPLQNLPLGTNIKNTAYIYFDYNPAIVTNTTESKYEVLTGGPSLPTQRAGEIQLYPNPTHQAITISSKDVIERVVLIDLLGNDVLNITNTSHKSTLKANVEALPAGIYICKVNGKLAGKVVKE